MFIGHFAVAFAGKKVAPKVSLGVLFLAAQFLDVLWPVFVLLGAEHFRIISGITKVSPFDFYDFPISHSLVASATETISEKSPATLTLASSRCSRPCRDADDSAYMARSIARRSPSSVCSIKPPRECG